MGRIGPRLRAAEEALIDSLLLEIMVEAEVREMLRVLEASDVIERPLYERVRHIITKAKDERWRA